MGYVIRSKNGMTFETTEIGKTGEQIFETAAAAEKALEQMKSLYRHEEFYITIKEKE